MRQSDSIVSSVIGQACSDLAREGYCVIRELVEAGAIAQLNRDLDKRFERTPFCDGAFYGRRTKRFGSLLTRSPHVASLVMHPTVRGVAERILDPFCDRIALNLTQAIEIHPGALAQYPHRDQDMWQGPKGEIEYLLNVIWPLSPFTADNGATRIWPGSHREHRLESDEPPLAITLDPGAALLFLGSTRHGGGENRSASSRRGIIVSYCLGWLRSFENQYLVYPPEIASHFDPELAALVGYAQHRPNLGNVEGQCPSVLLGDGGIGRPPMIDGLAAIDALLPEQAEALAAHVAEAEAARAGLLGG